MEGEIARIARMRGRAHISAGNLISDFSQLRTTLQIFSLLLAAKKVAICGPGYSRTCPLRVALSHIADLHILIDGTARPKDRIAQLTTDPIIGFRPSGFKFAKYPFFPITLFRKISTVGIYTQ